MSEETEKEFKLKRIQIKTESGTKWFKTCQDFMVWVNEQKNTYAFISKVPNQHNEHALLHLLNQQWQLIVQIAERELPGLIREPEQYSIKVDALVEQFQNQIKLKQIFTIDASFAQFIGELSIENPQKAVFSLAWFLSFHITNWDLNVAKGVQSAIDWERDFHGRVEYEENSLKTLKESWDAEFERQSNNVESSQQHLDHLNKRAQQLIDAQQKRFDKNIENYNNRLDSALDKATTELENITRTYDENLALHASVRYWKLQELFHKKKAFWLAILTSIIAILVLAGVWVYADYFLAAGVQAIHVSKLVTGAILTTFGIWAVRTCANLFMSHTHLRTDAQERRTMMHTYLALLRKGQGPKDDERQLILQTLFRPSATGMIKEDAGPTSIIDMLNRFSSKNK